MRVKVVVSLSMVLVLVSATAAGAIANGQPDGNRHPYVGMVFDVGSDGGLVACSGVLVGPRVFITAAHCTEAFLSPPPSYHVKVSFAPDATGLAAQVIGTPHTYPGFCPGCGGAWGRNLGDIGVIALDTPVQMSQYARLPTVGQDDGVAGTSVTDVGYGIRSGANGCRFYECLPGDFGVRTMTTGVAVDAGSLRDSFVKANGAGTMCFGDSGGPILAGNGPTVLAINDYVTDWSCAGVWQGTRIDNAAMLSWIRSWM